MVNSIYRLILILLFLFIILVSPNSRAQDKNEEYVINFEKHPRISEDGLIILLGKGKTVLDLNTLYNDPTGQTFTFPTECLIDSLLPITKTKIKVMMMSERVILVDASVEGTVLEFLLRGSNTIFPMIFVPVAEIILIGKVRFGDYFFESNNINPLTIKIAKNKLGYNYIAGQGKVTKGNVIITYPDERKKQ